MAKSGGGQSQADRHLPEAVQSMKNLPVSALACGMFHTLCLVSACVSVCARACVVCFCVCVCVCVCRCVCACGVCVSVWHTLISIVRRRHVPVLSWWFRR
jgi:hypothetical protein